MVTETSLPLPIVLVVDDDPRVRSFVRSALAGTVSLLEAPDGEQALRVLERHGGHNLDLVLVDQVIPEPSGLEVLRTVHLRWPWIPAIMITGFGSEDLAIEAFRAGARDYLKKPIELDRLRRTVVTLTSAPATTIPAGALERWVETAGAPAHPGVSRALAFVREHFTEALTLSDVARAASLSKFHFCRLFRRETGLAFRDYLQGLRVQRARALLADPRLTVTEVAYAVGFNDLSHFDKVFRRIAGVPPSEYRRTLRSP